MERVALILPADRVASSEAQAFANFPGLYTPGEPTLVELSAEDAERLIDELNLPLEIAEPEDDDLNDLHVDKLRDRAEKLELDVQRSDGKDGAPLKEDYVLALREHALQADKLPVAGLTPDELEPGQDVPQLVAGQPIASSLEGGPPLPASEVVSPLGRDEILKAVGFTTQPDADVSEPEGDDE